MSLLLGDDENSGQYFDTGSSKLHCWFNAKSRAANEVMALLTENAGKRESLCTEPRLNLSRDPAKKGKPSDAGE